MLLNFKQGRIANTVENVEMIQQKVEEHENQISQQTVFSKVESLDAEDNLYHTVLTNDNAAGQLEFIDTLDDAEKGDKVIVFLHEDGELVQILKPINEDLEELNFLDYLPWSAENEEWAADYASNPSQIVTNTIRNKLYTKFAANWEDILP